MVVTAESAAQSILRWSDLNTFNGGNHPWTAWRPTQEQEQAPNTVAEVETFLGEELGDNSYAVVQILKQSDAKLGFVAGHNPCF